MIHTFLLLHGDELNVAVIFFAEDIPVLIVQLAVLVPLPGVESHSPVQVAFMPALPVAVIVYGPDP